MTAIAYPDAFRATTAYLTTFIGLDDDPDLKPLADAMFTELGKHHPNEVVIVLTAMVGALVNHLAAATGDTVEETWAQYALAYSAALTEGGE
ncbi:hypothetical protein [Streptomyces sp. NPDC006477]|uniref:hypothetical protein n=1 Tax=Streptomyces sp. NPDC006477 TaxID=3364747 RepID=UPI0036C101F5